MLSKTSSKHAPWTVVRGDKKKPARLAIMRHLLHELAPAELRKGVAKPDKDILFRFNVKALSDGRLER
jgi:hypothetical protein